MSRLGPRNGTPNSDFVCVCNMRRREREGELRDQSKGATNKESDKVIRVNAT